MKRPAEETKPTGTAGRLAWDYWPYPISAPVAPEIGDVLVARPKPFRLVLWEPLLTKAPGPHLARPWCCYNRSVIFYDAQYRFELAPHLYRDSRGHLQRNSRPGFFQWDQIEYRLGGEARLAFEDEVFTLTGGRVLWASGPNGVRRQWWLCAGARRVQASSRAA